MIPKIIHYCWLSGEPMPASLQRCIRSWGKYMPDYQIKCWDTHAFDIHSVPFVEQACKVRKWAFAADYIRLYSLYVEGGIYLDSDVMVYKPFDQLLKNEFFSGVEFHPQIFHQHGGIGQLDREGCRRPRVASVAGAGIQAAILGARAGHPFIKDCLDFYAKKDFIDAQGNYFTKLISPGILAIAAEKYGFRYIDELQHLQNDMTLYPSALLGGNPSQYSDVSLAVHQCAGSWLENPPIDARSRMRSILRILKLVR